MYVNKFAGLPTNDRKTLWPIIQTAWIQANECKILRYVIKFMQANKVELRKCAKEWYFLFYTISRTFKVD